MRSVRSRPPCDEGMNADRRVSLDTTKAMETFRTATDGCAAPGESILHPFRSEGRGSRSIAIVLKNDFHLIHTFTELDGHFWPVRRLLALNPLGGPPPLPHDPTRPSARARVGVEEDLGWGGA